MTTLRLETLSARIGTVVAESEPVAITQERVNEFADATDDRQWLHVDPIRAASGPFGGTIAHGFLTLSLLPALFDRCVNFEGEPMLINYGLNKLRFPAPVRVGRSVRLRATVNDVREVPNGVEVALGFEIGEPQAEKPAAVGESVLRIYPGER